MASAPTAAPLPVVVPPATLEPPVVPGFVPEVVPVTVPEATIWSLGFVVSTAVTRLVALSAFFFLLDLRSRQGGGWGLACDLVNARARQGTPAGLAQ